MKIEVQKYIKLYDSLNRIFIGSKAHIMMNKYVVIIFSGILLAFIACAAGNPPKTTGIMTSDNNNKNDSTLHANDTAIFGAGCFWCVEAVFQRLQGVIRVESGYTGGTLKNPTYKEVCSGTTGHAEACRITFDHTKISYRELLAVLFTTHDPTTLNRQGADEGSQYRSAIFYLSEEQKDTAVAFIHELDSSGIFASKIVTEVSPASVFYEAEDYHQNFYNQNSEYGYCRAVINPKLEKLRKLFKDKLKD